MADGQRMDMVRLLLEGMDESEYNDTAYAVVPFSTPQELEEKLNRWAHMDYYPILEVSGSIILRAPREKPKEITPDVCTIWGGYMNGSTVGMRQALACWGAGLLNKPTGGVANVTATGRKAQDSEWRDLIDKIFHKTPDSGGEAVDVGWDDND